MERLNKILSIIIKLAITLLEYAFVVLVAYAFQSDLIAFIGGAIVALRLFNRFTR